MVGSQCVYSMSGSGGSRPLRVTAFLTRNPEYKGAYSSIRQTQVASLQNKVGTFAALLAILAETLLFLLTRTQLIM